MYNRRIKIFLGGIGLIFLVIVGRLWHLQIIRGEDYRREIERSLHSIEFFPANRGQILDRTGRILAVDQPCFDFCMDYRLLASRWAGGSEPKSLSGKVRQWRSRQIREIIDSAHGELTREEAEGVFDERAGNTWSVAEELSAGAGLDLQTAVARIIRRVEAVRGIIGGPPREQYEFHPVVTGLDDAAALAVKLQLDQMAGASIRPSHRRFHPYGQAACHVIGLTGPVNKRELESLNMGEDQADWLTRRLENYWYSDLIGKSGLERMCEPVLRGRRGYRSFKIRSGQVLQEQAASPGRDIHSTLDIALQGALMEVFPEDQTGCIVILSVPRGEVLALVSIPTFDPNRYRQDYERLVSDEVYSPLYHRAVAGLYAPGSTAKPLTALAGLSGGVVNLSEEVFCRGYLHSPGSFHCWIYDRHGYGHGGLNLVGAVKNSCNIFFYTVGERLYARAAGRQNEFLDLCGFTQPPGTGLPEEKPGSVSVPDSRGVARMLAIGQGPISVTPLHVANAMAAIARGGEFRTPVLVLEGCPAQQRRSLDLASSHVEAVRQGMYQVVNNPGGTAYRPFHDPEAEPLGVVVCGKTGTAESPPLVIDGRVCRAGDMAWFAGFAPYRDPRIALAVVVEYSEEGGSRQAGPIAREAVRICKQLGYIH